MKRQGRDSRKPVPQSSRRALAVYAVFLAALCTLALGTVSSDRYYLHRVMSQVFLEPSSKDSRIGFRSIRSRDDFWRGCAPGPSPALLPFTRGTRVVFIDFSTYNANINLFCIIRLVVEFPASGAALTSSHFYSMKLLRYITCYDYFLASCEICFGLFTFIFITQEAVKIIQLKKKKTFRSAWNWLDLLLLVVSILAIAFNTYRTAEVSLLLEELLSDPHTYPDCYFLAFCQVLYNTTIAVTLFLAWIKILKYINFNKTMALLSCTLSRCAEGIFGFSIIIFIIFFAYAQLGYLVFGSQVEEFSTFQNCIFTQFRMVLGDFKFETIEAADRILGPFYFITFVFFVFFISLALVKLQLKKPEMGANAADESLERNRAELRADFNRMKRKTQESPETHTAAAAQEAALVADTSHCK